MSIDNVPAVQIILEQNNLLERVFHTPLSANLAYSRLADDEIFPNGIGETLTKSRPALYPLSAAMTPLNPSNNTGLDNGLSDTYYTFEQYQIAISEYALSTTVNIKQDRTLIQRIFLQNYGNLGEHAGRTIDGLCSQYVHQAYDSGNTFATAAIASGVTTLHVDNIKGFDLAFSNTNSPGLPTAVSAGNPITATVYDPSSGNSLGTVSVTGATAEGSNTSTAYVGSVAYGVSGNLTLSGTQTFAIPQYAVLVANDGAAVIRPNGKLSRSGNGTQSLAAADVLNLVTLAQAVAKLRARNVPALPNGMYACIIDPTLWSQLLNDQAFQRATMGQMGEAGYFRNGMVNRTLGLEFVNSNLVPTFNIPGGSLKARHAVVGGRGLLVKGTYQGHIESARQASQMQNSDIRLIEEAKIALITRGPLDRLQEFVTQSWNWVGGFVTPTDVTSTPSVIPTTDLSRYKRAVIVEVASAS